MSTAQQSHDQNQARFVIPGVFLLGLAGMAFAAYFLKNIAGDHKIEAGSHGGDHGAPGHGEESHGDPTHSNENHSSNAVSHTGIAAGEFSITAPEAPVLAGDVTVTGIGTPGSTVSVKAAGTQVDATVGEDGTWSAPFEFGPGQVTVEASDGKHPPSQVIFTMLAPDAGGPSLGFSSPKEGEKVAAGPLMLKGTARPGELVRVTQNGKQIAEVKADDKGVWEFEVADYTPAATEFKAFSLGDNTTAVVRVNP